MSSLAAIHVAKKQLGLDDDTYRAVLVRVAGEDSAGKMTEAQRQRVVEELHRLGFTKASNGPRKRLRGRFAGKLQALWIAGWNLGIVADREDSALIAFVKRQTGIDHAQWLRDADEADKVIEALKAWLAREGGVDWSRSRFLPDWTQTPGYRIATAQWYIITGAAVPPITETCLQSWIIRAGYCDFVDSVPTDKQWIEIMNALGLLVRKVRKP